MDDTENIDGVLDRGHSRAQSQALGREVHATVGNPSVVLALATGIFIASSR